MKKEIFVSVVLASDRSIGSFLPFLKQTSTILAENYSNYEIVFVGTFGRGDPSVDIVLTTVPCVRWLQLTEIDQPEVVWSAGLENSIGDYVILMDPICDPPAIIPALIHQCYEGSDVVVGTARLKRFPLYKIFRILAVRILSSFGYNFPRNSTSLRCLSRRAVNTITQTGKFYQELYQRIQATGYPISTFQYELAGPFTKRNFLGGARSFMRFVVFSSTRPLRYMSMLGVLGCGMAVAYSLYSLIFHFINRLTVEGWTSTILFMSSFFMLVFIILAFFGEYLGRILDERNPVEPYSVVSERHSKVMIHEDRVNVFTESQGQEGSKVQTGRDQ